VSGPLENPHTMNALTQVSNDSDNAILDAETKQGSSMLLQTCEALHQENARLRHVLDNERFEERRLRNAVVQLREQIADQSRELEASSLIIAQLRAGEAENVLLKQTIVDQSRELEKSSCMIADLRGCHEQKALLNEQLVSCRRELEQSSSIVANLNRDAVERNLLQEQIASLGGELEQSSQTIAEFRLNQQRSTLASEQISRGNRELEQRLLSLSLDLRRLENSEERYQEILASTSWKVTRPLRALGGVFKSFGVP
jgi:chromosome segregation ATPase